LLERLARIPQILVVGVEGAAMGGGLGLVCVSDIALASEDATFGTPEVTLGLVPAQIAPFLVRRVGRAQAQRLALLGARLGARQALALGLVHEVLADGSALERSLADVVDQARRCGPRAVARTKWLLSRVGEMTMGRVLDDAADVFAESIADEAPEGIAAFLKRSVPRWAE
jgi:isohexenylglutaconyl-CoA hydratase